MKGYGSITIILSIMIIILGFLFGTLMYKYNGMGLVQKLEEITGLAEPEPEAPDTIEVMMGTFLGNEERNFYGDSIPNSLNVIWKHELGSGPTIVKGGEVETWSGAGWTGQPLIVTENGHPYLIQGCYDHHLKKIDAITGDLVWEYEYDDILKGTGTIWENKNSKDDKDRFVILQGSRLGLHNSLSKDVIPSFRAISYMTGKELWRLNVRRGPSYSRDVDGSALVLNDTIYIGLENGYFTRITAGEIDLNQSGPYLYKNIISEDSMFTDEDKLAHGGELVIESSPARIGDHLYVTTGSGHVYGYDLVEKRIDWDLFLGPDMNGSPVVTNDSCLIITLEKQFIPGRGGAMKIDPSKHPDSAVVWFLPTEDQIFSGWDGGVVGTASVNDYYKDPGDVSLVFVAALDGYLYMAEHDRVDTSQTVKGPDNKTLYHPPLLLSKKEIGSTISTPICTKNRVCVAGYFGIHIFEITRSFELVRIAYFKSGFESTPTAYQGRIYIASRNGNLYCFGNYPDI